ncbi:unnamed protein product [Onchocerca flexuosa]|uniref:Serine/arginine repetitive matrix protein 2 n=1 Tax=Onchocerca flexuosa TaxID=387005 RepID=A0A183I3I5_9BILA|nr:unnamed protein product [Onchocerca flexuosa]
MQLAIFGWQMAAIKYEKDRAADAILPNYNEYGRLDIPSYYESYWQSPEERFYIELEHPVKSGYRKNEPSRRDQYNLLQDYTMAQQSAPVTPTQIRKTTFADDLVSTWVKEQQSIKDLSDHANSEPITQQKPEDVYSLKIESGSRRHDHSDHDRRRSSSRHRHHLPSLRCSSESLSTDYSDDPYLIRHRSRSLESNSIAADDLKILEGHRSRRSRTENDYADPQRFEDRRRGSRKSKRNQHDIRETVLNDTVENVSPTVAVQTDSVATHWPLDPQRGLTVPQKIIIPPSRGTIGPDGRPQPQTYQISSEIRISYDQNGRPISQEVPSLPRKSDNAEQVPPTRSQPRVSLS